MSIFGRSESGARTELVPSAPLDVYLTNDDIELGLRIDVLLGQVLITESIAKKLLKFVGEKTKNNYIQRLRNQIEILVLNVIDKYPRGQTIGMARGKNAYVAEELFGPSNVSREIIEVADGLSELGLLGINIDRAQEFVSRLIASEDLVSLIFTESNESNEAEVGRLVSTMKSSECGIVLKRRKRVFYQTKNGTKRSKWSYLRVPYRALVEIEQYELRVADITRWQEFLWSFELTYQGQNYERKGLSLKSGMSISRKLQRHFRGTLDIPLRFYGTWQQIPSELRQFICINNQRTVELDFGCFFPVLLLSQAGIEWTDRFRSKDAYQLEWLHHAAANLTERKALRSFFKDVFVTYCFDTIHTAENVIRRFNLDLNDFEESESYGFPDEANQPVLDVISRLTKLPVRQAVEQVVREYCTMFDGVDESLMDWKLLQQQESKITELVLNACIERNIPCLPIHDGYRIVHGYDLIVTDFMKQACIEVTGSENFFIKIDDPERPNI